MPNSIEQIQIWSENSQHSEANHIGTMKIIIASHFVGFVSIYSSLDDVGVYAMGYICEPTDKLHLAPKVKTSAFRRVNRISHVQKRNTQRTLRQSSNGFHWHASYTLYIERAYIPFVICSNEHEKWSKCLWGQSIAQVVLKWRGGVSGRLVKPILCVIVHEHSIWNQVCHILHMFIVKL